jgi:hypothetical protein
MDLTEGFETSAKLNLTPGKYPKENIQDAEQGENLKSRRLMTLSFRACLCLFFGTTITTTIFVRHSVVRNVNLTH